MKSKSLIIYIDGMCYIISFGIIFYHLESNCYLLLFYIITMNVIILCHKLVLCMKESLSTLVRGVPCDLKITGSRREIGH